MAHWDESDVQRCINIDIKHRKKDRAHFVEYTITGKASLLRDEHLGCTEKTLRNDVKI